MTIPLFAVLWPATLCPPPRTATSRLALARGVDGGDDIGGARAPDDQGRSLVVHGVEDLARFVVARVGGHDQVSGELPAQRVRGPVHCHVSPFPKVGFDDPLPQARGVSITIRLRPSSFLVSGGSVTWVTARSSADDLCAPAVVPCATRPPEPSDVATQRETISAAAAASPAAAATGLAGRGWAASAGSTGSASGAVAHGLMFWLSRNTLVGSYSFFSATRRA